MSNIRGGIFYRCCTERHCGERRIPFCRGKSCFTSCQPILCYRRFNGQRVVYSLHDICSQHSNFPHSDRRRNPDYKIFHQLPVAFNPAENSFYAISDSGKSSNNLRFVGHNLSRKALNALHKRRQNVLYDRQDCPHDLDTGALDVVLHDLNLPGKRGARRFCTAAIFLFKLLQDDFLCPGSIARLFHCLYGLDLRSRKRHTDTLQFRISLCRVIQCFA